MTSVSYSSQHTSSDQGLRPVDLRRDLAPLADLIELVFASSMDENGRAAIREMRYLSRMGVGLNLLGRLNEMALGISLGYVWIEQGRLVGNVSIYPANWPSGAGSAWIIANVGVHPEFQGRGIARRLMEASLNLIRNRRGQYAILQVDYDNDRAIHLYDRLGFIRERPWTTWWRGSLTSAPPWQQPADLHITRRRPAEWRAEYELAARSRPREKGGIGWLRPLHQQFFHKSLLRQMADWFTMNSLERLVIRSEDEKTLLASLWIDSGLTSSRTRLTLLNDPDQSPLYAEALLGTTIRRFRSSSLGIEHPQDDTAISQLLRDFRFFPTRTVWHMRLDL